MGAAQSASAPAAAGRTISVASSVTTSTSICSSSVGVRSKTPVDAALAGRSAVPVPRPPARANVRPAAVATRNPLRVVRNTARSVCLRNPIRSISSLCASRFTAATASPIGSRVSRDDSPWRPPGRNVFMRYMPPP